MERSEQIRKTRNELLLGVLNNHGAIGFKLKAMIAIGELVDFYSKLLVDARINEYDKKI